MLGRPVVRLADCTICSSKGHAVGVLRSGRTCEEAVSSRGVQGNALVLAGLEHHLGIQPGLAQQSYIYICSGYLSRQGRSCCAAARQ